MRGRYYCSGMHYSYCKSVTVGRSYPAALEHLSIGTLSRVAQQLTAALIVAASSSCVVSFFATFVYLSVMLPDE